MRLVVDDGAVGPEGAHGRERQPHEVVLLAAQLLQLGRGLDLVPDIAGRDLREGTSCRSGCECDGDRSAGSTGMAKTLLEEKTSEVYIHIANEQNYVTMIDLG